MSRWHNISVAQAEHMIAERDVLVFDIRDFRSYLAGHHYKAVHLDSNNLRSVLKQTARDQPIIIYCYHGNSSQDMAQLFADFGFEDVYSLDGGYELWAPTINRPKAELSDALRGWMQANGFDQHNLDLRVWNNETALLRAARQGEMALCQELIKAGASLNVKNKDGNNALWMACVSNSVELVEYLVGQGVDIDNQNDNGATALIYTASAGKTALVRLFVQLGADFNLATLDDFTALSVAGNKEILKYLRTLAAPVASHLQTRHAMAI